MDTISPATRSSVMAMVRSNRNKSTEWRLRASLVRAGIRGWNLNPTDVFGKPDFVFRSERLAVFVDGCFWHGCIACGGKTPRSNTVYWERKIERNRRRDRLVSVQLRRDGWRVIRIWEHELGTIGSVMARISKALASEVSRALLAGRQG
ncbi:MAG: very short patch repair endonuclease [Bryobacterales bacterium]|nr:very short patch repair endonuclease [Bryobacterales bacterium]